MAEHERDRTFDIDRDELGDRNIVRDGSIGRDDAEIEDVTRDTYSTPIGSRGPDDHEAADDDRTSAREVLGIADVVPGSGMSAEGTSDRRRRADDLVEGGLGPKPSGAPYEDAHGLKVRD